MCGYWARTGPFPGSMEVAEKAFASAFEDFNTSLRLRIFDTELHFELFDKTSGNMACMFSLRFFPGTQRFLISSEMFVSQWARGRGIGKRALLFKEELAKSVGAKLVATVNEENEVEKNLLLSSGWKPLLTNSSTTLWGKE